jgi:hypothetical protein
MKRQELPIFLLKPDRLKILKLAQRVTWYQKDGIVRALYFTKFRFWVVKNTDS